MLVAKGKKPERGENVLVDGRIFFRRLGFGGFVVNEPVGGELLGDEYNSS